MTSRSSFVVTTWIWLALLALSYTNLVQSSRRPEHKPRLRRLHGDGDDGNDGNDLSEYYHLWPPEQIHQTMHEWSDMYPDLVKVTTSQVAYGLPRAGGPDDCPYDDGDGCNNHIMTIQDYTVHPEGSASSNALPEVLWSGCVHGNERVGPTAVMEAAALLLEAAACEAKPNKAVQKHVGHAIHDGTTWENELATAKLCRKALEDKGVRAPQRQWLARLVATRRIVIVPTANALGYFRNVREEEQIDPNRDFPFDITDSTQCMQTIAGRTLNEVFREHMFQLSLTFHGGMEVVAYEWGAPTYLKYLSPDDEAQSQIASAYSRYGGGWKASNPYNYGTMNDLVYYVRGGMEDWAYAASWDPERVIVCKPTTYGGYSAEKSQYNDSTLRVFNMLVETSDTKEPTTYLGKRVDVFKKDTSENGHVSRNIRLALLAADIVEPYVSIISVNELAISDDILPLTLRDDRTTCQRTKGVMVPQNVREVTVEWTVGGALDIDETSLVYGRWSDMAENDVSCMAQPITENLSKLAVATDLNALNGTGFFSKNGPSPLRTDSQRRSTLGPVFRATLDVSAYKPREQVVVLARARVDQSWQNQPGKIKPNLAPQAHVVNARTNPGWHHESAGKVVQGRLDWYTTIPLTIVIGDYFDSVGSQAGREVGTIELSNRFGHTTGGTTGGITPTSQADSSGWKQLLGMFFVVVCGSVACAFCVQYKRDATHQRIINELMDEEEGVFEGSKPYSDYIEDDELEGELDLDDDEEEEAEDVLAPENEHDGDLEMRQYTID